MSRIVLLENIRSLHNVGAVFRTADAAGWDKIILTGYTGTPPDRRIEKVSLGAENTLAWEHNTDPVTATQILINDGYTVWALEQTPTAIDIFAEKNLPKKLGLVLGNEVTGVSPELLSLCHTHVQIPMHGIKESLNVSVATGIALYALRG